MASCASAVLNLCKAAWQKYLDWIRETYAVMSLVISTVKSLSSGKFTRVAFAPGCCRAIWSETLLPTIATRSAKGRRRLEAKAVRLF